MQINYDLHPRKLASHVFPSVNDKIQEACMSILQSTHGFVFQI